MRLRPLLAPGILMLGTALGSSGASPGDADGAPRSCRSSGSTVEENGVARLFTLTGGTVYGCLKAGGRIRDLGSEGDLGRYDTGVRQHTLAGRYVAWVEYACDPDDGCTGRVAVTGLAAGRPTRRSRSTDATVLLPSVVGDVVWAGRGGIGHLSSRGATTLLDTSAGIDSNTLVRTVFRAYWIRDGQAQTALLTRRP